MENKKCPKCSEKMNIGYINTPMAATWTPDKKLAITHGVKYHTYACPKCGFMESYLDLNK